MLISWILFTKLFYPNQLNSFSNSLKTSSSNNKEYKENTLKVALWFCILVIFLLFNVVPAVLICNACDKSNVFKLILAVLFSDVYVFHYSIRKFIFKDNYCNI